MRTRLSRIEQTGQNRERVLEAARRVFMARGFHTATLDQIADEAGFSKGAIYSQFASKADVFLTLLERRIEDRAAHHSRFAAQLEGVEDFAALHAEMARISSSDPAWRLLVIEFRVFAARDKALNRRYAELHRRTLAGVASLLLLLYERSGVTPPAPVEVLAANLIAHDNGIGLEQAAAVSFRPAEQSQILVRMLGAPPPRAAGRRT
jgi:AcrR family transcriptional regulator